MFLAPLFLVGLIAAAVPLLLHLRRTTRVKNVVFSTTRFFDERFVQSSRRAKFQDVLIMLLRVGLITLFVLALAQPLFRLPGLAALTGSKRTVAIVIDDSASMAATGSEGSSLELAKRGALRVIDDLSSLKGDRVTIVLAGRRDAGPRVLFPQPSDDLDAVRDAVRQIPITDMAGDLPAAIEQSRQLIGAPSVTPSGNSASDAGSGASGAREVYVFSDLQASGFGSTAAVSGGLNTSVIFVACNAITTTESDNLSVDAVQYGTSRPMVGVPFTFLSLISNHGQRERAVEAKLFIGEDVVAHKTISIPPGRGRVVRFVSRFAKPGQYKGRVEIGPDANDTSSPVIDSMLRDDRRYFSLQVEQNASILAINGSPSNLATRDELFFLRLALTASPDAAIQNSRRIDNPSVDMVSISPEQVTAERLKPHPLVIVANVGTLSNEALEALEHYTDTGGNLFITCGDKVTPQTLAQWSSVGRLHGGLLPGVATRLISSPGNSVDDSAGIIGSVADDHPALAGFTDGRMGLLSSITFRSRIAFDAPQNSVLMRTASGDPILAEKRFGKGRVVFFGSSIDRDWTNFPLQPAFVPWLFRVVSYCVQPSLDDAGFFPAGKTIRLPTAATQLESMQVILPDGSAVPATQSRLQSQDTSPALEFAATERAGVYLVRAASDATDGAPRFAFAVNIPSDESVPIRFDKDALSSAIASDTTWSFADGPDAAVEVGQVARQGLGLWDQLLLAALLVAVAEPWIANRLSRRRLNAEPDAMSRRDPAHTNRSTIEHNAA